jgi:hypothetical protein
MLWPVAMPSCNSIDRSYPQYFDSPYKSRFILSLSKGFRVLGPVRKADS